MACVTHHRGGAWFLDPTCVHGKRKKAYRAFWRELCLSLDTIVHFYTYRCYGMRLHLGHVETRRPQQIIPTQQARAEWSAAYPYLFLLQNLCLRAWHQRPERCYAVDLLPSRSRWHEIRGRRLCECEQDVRPLTSTTSAGRHKTVPFE